MSSDRKAGSRCIVLALLFDREAGDPIAADRARPDFLPDLKRRGTCDPDVVGRMVNELSSFEVFGATVATFVKIPSRFFAQTTENH